MFQLLEAQNTFVLPTELICVFAWVIYYRLIVKTQLLFIIALSCTIKLYDDMVRPFY
jgi:hypothetical protein